LEIKRTKKSKKEELRSDPVLEGIIKAKEAARENSSRLIVALAVLLLAIGGFAGYSYVKKQGLRKAQEAFGAAMVAYNAQDTAKAVEALTLVVDNHRGAPQGGYAAYLLGDMYMAAGKYDQAITWLDIAAGRRNAGFVAGEAVEALAMCYEATGDLEQAVEHYRRALEDERISYRFPAIRWKLALVLFRDGQADRARPYCEQLVQDTLAGEYRQKAENLLAENQLL
jgi:tetratricopeptide (TPR) repeat protein